MKHEREHDPVSYGIHNYATKCKAKHIKCLSSLMKLFYHLGGKEIPCFRIFLGDCSLGNTRLSDKLQSLTDQLEQGDHLRDY